MKIHCIGDSHTSFFSGYNFIQAEFPEIGKSIVRNIFTYRIGAPLAYNLCDWESNSRSHEKLLKILTTLKPKEDFILLCFGEIDCRAHIIRQAEISGIEISAVVAECVTRYLKVILEIKSKKFDVGVWNVIPTAISIESQNPEFPHYGNYVQRNKVSFMFNEKMKEYSCQHGFYYFGIFGKLIKKNWVTREKYYLDKIHLNTKALPYTLKGMQSQNKNFNIRNIDILQVRISNCFFFFHQNDRTNRFFSIRKKTIFIYSKVPKQFRKKINAFINFFKSKVNRRNQSKTADE